MFEISSLELIKNDFLTIVVNFDIGSAFPKGPKTTFSESPCLVLDPLYKVCS